MEKYITQNFLDASLRIKEIRTVYHAESRSWRRENFLPRQAEGLLLFSSGTIRYDFGDFSFTASAGQVLKLPAGIPYRGDKLDDVPLRFYCMDFLAAEPGEYLHYPLPMSFTPSDFASVQDAFTNLEHIHQMKGIGWQSDSMSHAYRLISMLTRDAAARLCGTDAGSRAIQISDYIRENAFRSDLRVTDIAEHFHMSPTHLRRIFAAQLGISPSAVLNTARLDNARRMLLDSRLLSIGEIALLCGYSSVYYFSQSFREATGQSPSKWRESHLIP